jgi:cardiolipin synthase
MQVAIIALVVASFAACKYTTPTTGTGSGGTTGTGSVGTTGTGSTTAGGTTPTPCGSNCPTLTGDASNVTLNVEPDDGDTAQVNAIKNAQKSVWMEMYLLTEHNVINALENDANRGVDVRVMLEPNPVGGGSQTQTLDALNAAGVHAQPTAPVFDNNGGVTHAKLVIIDGQTALISSGNYTLSALGGSSYTRDRDYLITDTNSADVQECITIFNADWNHTTPQVSDPALVVSPVNSRAKLTDIIQSAKQSLHLEEEEMQDPQIVQALIAAAGRGVSVELVVPSSNSDGAEIQQLTQHGVKVTQLDDRAGAVYIHAKLIIADGTLAYVGSINMSTYSMDINREIGVLVSNTTIIQRLETTFETDFNATSSGS